MPLSLGEEKKQQKVSEDATDTRHLPLTSWAGIKAVATKTFAGVSQHDVFTLSAALAFYTALALAPLLVITLTVVGLLGENSQAQLLAQIQGLLGNQAASAINAIIESSQKKPDTGTIAGIVSILVLLFSASGVFAQIQSSLNVIFEAQGKVSKGAWGWIRKRILSMGMVLTLGFLAMVSLVVSAALAFVFTNEGLLWKVINFAISLGVFTVLFGLLFKYLPDAQLSWKRSFAGGLVTAILFAIGKYLIGLYLGKSAVGSSYGAAGSLVVLLSWVYYSALILFSGAEITRVLTEREKGRADNPAPAPKDSL
jgi:membrane protein